MQRAASDKQPAHKAWHGMAWGGVSTVPQLIGRTLIAGTPHEFGVSVKRTNDALVSCVRVLHGLSISDLEVYLGQDSFTLDTRSSTLAKWAPQHAQLYTLPSSGSRNKRPIYQQAIYRTKGLQSACSPTSQHPIRHKGKEIRRARELLIRKLCPRRR